MGKQNIILPHFRNIRLPPRAFFNRRSIHIMEELKNTRIDKLLEMSIRFISCGVIVFT